MINAMRKLFYLALISLILYLLSDASSLAVDERSKTFKTFKTFGEDFSISDVSCLDQVEDIRSYPWGYLYYSYPSSFDLLLTYLKVSGREVLLKIEFLDLKEEDIPRIQLEFAFNDKGKVVRIFTDEGKLLRLPDRKPVGAIYFDTLNDYALAKLDLRRAGLSGDLKLFKVTSYSNGFSVDISPCTYPKLKPLRIAIVLHGNQPLINAGLFWERFWDEEERAGLLRTLLDIEDLRVPVELHLSGVLLENIKWHSPGDLIKLRELVREKLITLERGTWSEHLMPLLPSYLNVYSLKLNDLILSLSGLSSDGKGWEVCWTPERVIDGRTLEDLKRAGCKATLIDYPQLWVRDVPKYTPFRVNDVLLFPIDHLFQYDMFSTSDGGATPRLRLHLYRQFLRSQREDILLIAMNDWEFAGGMPFGTLKPKADIPNRFRELLSWLKMKPWLSFTTPTQYLRESYDKTASYYVNPTELKLQSYIEAEQGSDTILSWMYGDDYMESYSDYRPNYRGSWLRNDIVLQEPLGDFLGKRSGMIQDILTSLEEECGKPEIALRNSLRDTLCQLSWLYLLNSSYETAWHDWSVDPATQRKNISWWQKFWASDLRNSALGVNLLRLLRTKDGTWAGLYDLDMDGFKEGVIRGEKLIAVLEPVGGYLKLLITADGKLITGGYLNSPVSDGEAIYNPALKGYGNFHVRHRAVFGIALMSLDKEKSISMVSPSAISIYQLEVIGDNAIQLFDPLSELLKVYRLEGDTLTLKVMKLTISYRGELSILGVESDPIGLELALSPSYIRLLRYPQFIKISTPNSQKLLLRSLDLNLTLKAKGCSLRGPFKDFPYQVRAICQFQNIYLKPAIVKLKVESLR